MKILSLAAKSLLCALLVPVVACSLPRVATEVTGSDFELTADEPMAEFEVTLCVDTPDIDTLWGGAMVTAEVEAFGATGPVTVIGEADVLASDETGSRRDEREVQSGHAESLYFSLDAEGPWEGQSGRRCGEPQLVRFEYGGEPQDGARIEIDWTVHFDMEYDDFMRGGDQVYEDDLIIEIEPVT